MRDTNAYIEMGKTLNERYVMNDLLSIITLISEGQELGRKYFRKHGLSEKEFNAIVPKSLNKRTDTYEQLPLRRTLWNMYYIGLAIGNRIDHKEKFQWEIEEEQEIAEEKEIEALIEQQKEKRQETH